MTGSALATTPLSHGIVPPVLADSASKTPTMMHSIHHLQLLLEIQLKKVYFYLNSAFSHFDL